MQHWNNMTVMCVHTIIPLRCCNAATAATAECVATPNCCCFPSLHLLPQLSPDTCCMCCMLIIVTCRLPFLKPWNCQVAFSSNLSIAATVLCFVVAWFYNNAVPCLQQQQCQMLLLSLCFGKFYNSTTIQYQVY